MISIKILVDADACPVKLEIIEVAKKYNIEVEMFIDTSHVYNDGYSIVTTVSKGKDAVDIALINKLNIGDIVVTQDYGVATMVLTKGGYPINQNGLIYTSNNIDRLLFERYISGQNRKNKKRFKQHKKRVKEDNERFKESLIILCNKIFLNE